MSEESIPPTASFADALRALVHAESPSGDRRGIDTAHRTLTEIGRDLVGVAPVRADVLEKAPVLTWHLGDPDDPARVLLLGHVDTVWPRGTIDERPFTICDGRAAGPGVFDMKAGLVLGLQVLHDVGTDAPVSLMVTSDEEVGSWASRDLIAAEARRAQAVLVLEGAGPGGSLKSARKGWSIYDLRLNGTAAHAGLEPHKGRNALLRLASLIGQLDDLGDPSVGRTVTPTKASAGTTVNTIPDVAELSVDVRVESAADQDIVDRAIRDLAGTDNSGVGVHVSGGVNRPPMQRDTAEELLSRVRQLTSSRSGVPDDIAVGGISDANLTAALGIPTLDGLGAVGGGAHADHEWVDLEATTGRVALLTDLLRNLIREPLNAPAGDASATRRAP